MKKSKEKLKTKKEPLVSILVATYNRAHLIGCAIESALKQKYSNWEIIVCDDASTDNTEKVIEKWQKKDKRIKYIKSKKNQGIANNSNMGLYLAKGKYIAILDDDDRWIDENKLNRQVDFLEKNPDYVGCGGGVIVVNGSDKELYRYLKPETDQEIRKVALFSNPMANTTTLFRLTAAKKVGYYNKTMSYSADKDFWLKMGLIGKLYNFPEFFAKYLMTGENTSIKKIRPHFKSSLLITKRYKNKYPNYLPALIFNYFQYFYSFIPSVIRRRIHKTLARGKRLLFK
jgi:glycosyltransferase involved in cell wall biosynthesis